jgi:hypothetical protein
MEKINKTGVIMVSNILRIIIVILLIIILLSTAAVMIASALYNRQIDAEASQVLSPADLKQKDIVAASDLAGLPLCVAKWLECSKVLGKERIHTVSLTQRGRMRTAPDKPWIPLEAVQYVNVDQPGFVWKAQAKMAPLTNMVIRVPCSDLWLK